MRACHGTDASVAHTACLENLDQTIANPINVVMGFIRTVSGGMGFFPIGDDTREVFHPVDLEFLLSLLQNAGGGAWDITESFARDRTAYYHFLQSDCLLHTRCQINRFLPEPSAKPREFLVEPIQISVDTQGGNTASNTDWLLGWW